MTSVMLACYPEVFAGGAIIAGLPYGAASNVQQAFESMFQSPSRSAREWGDLVRAAAPYGGPWPRISVWHGTADKIVVPSNAREILKQWTDVHGLSTSGLAK
jgi:feruloyl esterase